MLLAVAAESAACNHSAANEARVRELNNRFATGGISRSNLGLVVRGYDASETSVAPSDPAWIMTALPALPGVVSSSLINSRIPYLFAGNRHLQGSNGVLGHVGVIFTMAAVHASLLCAYPRVRRASRKPLRPHAPLTARSGPVAGRGLNLRAVRPRSQRAMHQWLRWSTAHTAGQPGEFEAQ